MVNVGRERGKEGEWGNYAWLINRERENVEREMVNVERERGEKRESGEKENVFFSFSFLFFFCFVLFCDACSSVLLRSFPWLDTAEYVVLYGTQ